MKKFLSLTIAIVALTGALGTAAQAQTAGSRTMRARIPFAFHVASKELPAGEYAVTVLNPSSDHNALQIRSLDGRSSAIIQTFAKAANASENSKLMFRRYGQSYFFAEARVVGESTALRALKSKAERIEAETASRPGSKPAVAVVTAY